MSLTGALCNSITFKVINEYGKGAAVEIESVFRPDYHVACRGGSEKGIFRHLSNHVFRSP